MKDSQTGVSIRMSCVSLLKIEMPHLELGHLASAPVWCVCVHGFSKLPVDSNMQPSLKVTASVISNIFVV